MKFTKAHELLLSGLVQSKLRIHDCLDIMLALTTFDQAKAVLDWMIELVKTEDRFPTKKEIDLKVKSIVEGC